MKRTYFFFAMSSFVLAVMVSLVFGLGALCGMVLLFLHLEKLVIAFVFIVFVVFVYLFFKQRSEEV